MCPEFEKAPVYLFLCDTTEEWECRGRDELQDETSFLSYLVREGAAIITPGLSVAGLRVWNRLGIPVYRAAPSRVDEAYSDFLGGLLSRFDESDIATSGRYDAVCSTCSSRGCIGGECPTCP